MENSLLANFDEIWPKTMYYSTGCLARFWNNFKEKRERECVQLTSPALELRLKK